MHLYRLIILLSCLSLVLPAQAQIDFVAPTYNHIIAKAKKSDQQLQKRSVSLDTLPFVDDFALNGPFPDTDLWEDNHIFINQGLAKNPPSIGVATFDGLDKNGRPYGRNGSSDTLTSVPINLENITVNDLYISYFVQAKGFGDQPEATDSLILEFKDDSDLWIMQRSYVGQDGSLSLDSVEFLFDFVEIKSLGFIHEDFQFRFRNTSSGKGAIDVWHLDVVRVINNQIPSETYNDLAFQYPSKGILNRYSAMPINQFQTNTDQHLRSEFNVNIFNHQDVARPVGAENSIMEIQELVSGQVILAPNQFLLNTDINIGADTSVIVLVQKNFSVPSSVVNNQENLLFETNFTIDPDPMDNGPGLLNNNYITTQTIIDDYYAYDDSSAELGITAKGGGTSIAVEYEAYAEETLSAIAIHFPHTNKDVSDQFFNLKVWIGDLNSEPVFIGELLNPIYVDEFADTLQGFSTYRLEESFTGVLQPVVIPPGPFYIGWEQVTNEFDDAIPVGFDVNSDTIFNYNWVSTDSDNWQNFEAINAPNGAIMIRPIMGVENAIYTGIEKKLSNKTINRLYPNPSTGTVNLNIPIGSNFLTRVSVFDLQGKEVYTENLDSNSINLGFLPPGVYFIKIVSEVNDFYYQEKLILQPH